MLEGACRENVQKEGEITWERLPDIINGIACIGHEGDDKAKNYRRKTHGLCV
jgi:hypothetical protein